MLKHFVRSVMVATWLSLVSASSGAMTTQAQDAKVPVTTQDHLSLAKVYEDKAATYRKEVEFHKKMLESYKQQAAPTGKTGPNPWVAKMKKQSAEFHKLRAKELEGK